MSAKVRCLRTFSWKQFIAFGVFALCLCLLVSSPAGADQVGVVINTPAYIYEKPDFDSKLVSELGPDSKIRISTKKWGAFFRVQTPVGGVGYVSDGDVKPTRDKLENLATRASGPKLNSKNTAAQSAEPKPTEPKRTRDAWATAGMLGLEVGYLQYSEVVAKLQYSETEMDYGIKFSFPIRFFESPVHMDLNLFGHLSAPGYYAGISSTTPSGYYIVLDTPLLFTLGNFWKKSGAVYTGAGPMFNFSNYSVTLNNTAAQLEAVRIGAVIELGLEFEMGTHLVLKIEPRYFIEQQSYWGALASLQFLL